MNRRNTYRRRSPYSGLYEKEMRQLKRKQPSKAGVALVIFSACFLLVAFELGRSMRLMRRVNEFVQRLDKDDDQGLRAKLDEFAPYLRDRNPLVRNAAVVGFVAATHNQLNLSPYDWPGWWEVHRATWSYQLRSPTALSPELTKILREITNAMPPEVTTNHPDVVMPVMTP